MTPFEREARAHIASKNVKGTRELYRTDLERWLAFCAERKADLTDPPSEVASAFRDALLAHCSETTVRRILSSLSKMYKVCVARRAAAWNPFDVDVLARPPGDDVALTQAFTRAEVKALFAAVPIAEVIGLRDLTAMRLLYDTGLRVSSVTNLRRDQVLTRADGQRIVVTKVKKRGRVEVELPPSSVVLLDLWLVRAPASPYVFPAGRGSGPLTRRALNHRVALYGARAAVKDAGPHRFRATYITEALDAGVPLSEVQAAVHHADPKTTQRYDRGVRGSGVADAVARFRREQS